MSKKSVLPYTQSAVDFVETVWMISKRLNLQFDDALALYLKSMVALSEANRKLSR